MKRNVSLKTYLITILSVCIIFLVATSYIYGNPGESDEILIEPHSYVTEASYVVFKDGATTYMRNGTSGEISWSSTNSSAVINACVGNLTDGGKIFIKQGTYNAHGIDVSSNITLTGEGWSTRFDVNGNTGFRLAGVSNVLLSDFYIEDSSGRDDNGVRLSGCENVVVQRVKVVNTECGIGAQDNGNDIIFKDNYVEGSYDDDITFTGNITQSMILNNICTGMGYLDGSSGIEIDDGADHILISGNLIYDKNTTGIHFHHHEDQPCVNQLSIQNNIIRNVTMGIAGLIAGTGRNQDVLIQGNIINSTDESGIIVDQTDYVTIQGNHVNDFGRSAGTWYGIASSNSYYPSIDDNTVSGGTNLHSGLFYPSSAIEGSMQNNKVIGTPNAFAIDFESENGTLSGNIVRGVTGSEAVRVGASYVLIEGNSIIQNGDDGLLISAGDGQIIISNKLTDNLARALDIYAGNNRVVKFNDFSFYGSEAMRNLGTNTEFEGNIGFVTENSGTASNCVNGTYVAHGLASTPNQTLLTISGSNYINSTCFLMDPSVIATNSTHFQIGFNFYMNATAIYPVTTVEQKDVYWSCEYKP